MPASRLACIATGLFAASLSHAQECAHLIGQLDREYLSAQVVDTVLVVAGYHCVAEGTMYGLVTFDLRDPAAPAALDSVDLFLSTPDASWFPMDLVADRESAWILIKNVGTVETALIACSIGDPGDVQEAARLDLPRMGTDLALWDQVLAVGAEGVLLYDARDPEQPTLWADEPLDGFGAVAISDSLVVYGDNRLTVFRRPSPSQLALAGQWTPDPWDPAPNLSLCLQGSLAHGTSLVGHAYQIFDLGNPALPVRLAHVGNIVLADGLCVTDTLCALVDYPGRLHLFDVRDPSQPFTIAPPQAIVPLGIHRLAWARQHLMVMSHQARFYEVDCTADLTPAPRPRLPVLQAWPNPTNGAVTVRLDGGGPGPAPLCVFNLRGEVVLRHDTATGAGAAGVLTLDLAGLASGLYVLEAGGQPPARVKLLLLN